MIEFLIDIDIHFVYLFIFTLGLSFGTGATLLGNILFYTAVKDRKISHDEYLMLKKIQIIIWFGILLYAFGGLGLFTLAYESMLQIGIFYASIVIAFILIVNSLIFYFLQLPKFKNDTEEKNVSHYGVYIVSGIISLISWIFLNLYHSMHRSDIGFWLFMSMYVFVIFIAMSGIWFFFKQKFEREDIVIFKKASILAGLIAVLFLVVGLSLNIFVSDNKKDIKLEKSSQKIDEAKPEGPMYTKKDVFLHNNTEDCWVVIDDMVFDASVVAEKYPEIYSCGEDVTEKYRKVTPKGISERMMKYKIGFIGYTREEVALHNRNEDCWLIIDDFVFDATKAAKLHPATFNCGADASKNYHKNHGKDISNKMMRYKIGKLSEGFEKLNNKTNSKNKEVLKPYKELYVELGTWDPKDLMTIVEKDAEKLFFIDGSNNKKIGRVHDVGFQPHTSVFSPDAKYMYIISRDGWLTKIDLKTLKPLNSIKVGINSRGTALTDDGKYLAIGNYEPGNLVIVDPDSLKILKKIPTIGKINGEEVESRVGAVIEYKDKIIIALKDLNSVWVVDTAKKDFPVIKKRSNIGNNKTPLHDAFLTPDGKFFIVASMGSDTVWVMNTDTWEEVAEVKTGKTPHTGPGATWGDNIYVPALGEGLITVINTKTWEPIKYIKTAGPGLFVRAFSENPDYPYIWSETAFGEYKDEIYVIDARINKIIKTIIPVKGESSWHPEFTNNGKYVYIVSQSANEIEVYDAYSFELVKRFKADTPSAVSNIGNRIEELGL